MKLYLSHNYDTMNTCPAVKADGDVCGKRCRGAPRCAIHMRTLENNGPHTTARKELEYIHRAAVNRLRDERDILIAAQQDMVQRVRMREDLELDISDLKLRHRREEDALIRQQEDEIQRTGIDPDAVAHQRREELLRQRQAQQRAHWEQMFAERRIARQVELIENANANRAAVAAQEQGELRRFINDNQNVHTQAAVQQTKDIVQKILNIPVPLEYRWNMSECSKTPGDIIVRCKLTPKGSWQMISKYCQDEDIYELGRGIYGKVLDGVWQYVLNSSDKEDLYVILKQEMEDNIGMCAQGNLSRLCNILAGYMEGVGPQESPAEILGRKLPLLMEIEDDNERIGAAFKLLVELAIPQEQWLSWIEPLANDREILFETVGTGQVTGIRVV